MRLESWFYGCCLVTFMSCSDGERLGEGADTPMLEVSASDLMMSDNPFFRNSQLQLNYPEFNLIKNEHYLPAFEYGMTEHLREIKEIAEQIDDPGFENTIVALELSGQIYSRVARVFFSMSSAHTNDEIRKLEQDLAPRLASHEDSIYLNRQLFLRIENLYLSRNSLQLDAEAKRLLEQTYKNFQRAGAALNEADKEKLKELNAKLAMLETRFSQNILDEANDLAIIVDSREELGGLSEGRINSAAQSAENKGLPGKFVIPLLNTSGQPVLTSLQNRELRERIHKASLSRGNRGGEFDNRANLSSILKLRSEKARLLGFDNHAHYVVDDQTALTVDAVNQRLAELAAPAAKNVIKESQELQRLIDEEGGDFKLEAWDWDFYSERLRKERFDFDAGLLRDYFELDNVLKRGVFYAAERLFGISFEERFDLPVYQEDVRVFEVTDHNGEVLALFIADFYARPSKRGGAWMNAYVAQSKLTGEKPVIANHLNITKPGHGEPTLLTFDEVTTMFHEFGHALHGMFSQVQYPSFSGTRVPRDFVEYPSQVNEMWASWPEVLQNYALHYLSGEKLDAEILEKVLAAQSFNQGFTTSEYLAASIIDQAFHQLESQEIPLADDIMAFELSALEDAGLAISAVPPRYRATYFNHIMGGYSAGYYSYIWSEVLDADTVEWFKENGGLLRQNGEYFRESVLSRGGSLDAMQMYNNFRGREAEIRPLLKRRGLL